MSRSRSLVLSLLILVLGLTLLPYRAGAQDGSVERRPADEPGASETVTASINFTAPWGGRIVGAVVANRTLVSESYGVMYLKTEWTFNGTYNGSSVVVSGSANERWNGSPQHAEDAISTSWRASSGVPRPPFTSATISQSTPNLAYVGPYPVGVDGWIEPPFTRAHYVVTSPGKGPGGIGILPGRGRERKAPSAPGQGTIGDRLEEQVGGLHRRGGPQE